MKFMARGFITSAIIMIAAFVSTTAVSNAQVKQKTVSKTYGGSLAGGTGTFEGFIKGVAGQELIASSKSYATISLLNSSLKVAEARIKSSSVAANSERHLEAAGKLIYHATGYGTSTQPATTWSVFGSNPPVANINIGICTLVVSANAGIGYDGTATVVGSGAPSPFAFANGVAHVYGFGSAGASFQILGAFLKLSASLNLTFANTTVTFNGATVPGFVNGSCVLDWKAVNLLCTYTISALWGLGSKTGTIFSYSTSPYMEVIF